MYIYCYFKLNMYFVRGMGEAHPFHSEFPFSIHYSMVAVLACWQVGIITGNPGVFQGYPDLPSKNPYPHQGYGFLRVQVRVKVEYLVPLGKSNSRGVLRA